MARQALLLGGVQSADGILQRDACIGPVNQKEIHRPEAQRLDRRLGRWHQRIGADILVPDLGGHDECVPRDTAGARALADLALVAVHARRVEMAIAGLDRLRDHADAGVAG